MEFNFRAIDEQATNSIYRPRPPSSSFSCSTEQALRVSTGTMVTSANYLHSHSSFGRHHEFFPNPEDVRREAIQREIEKDRIREEILAAEAARRRVLEAEVRRELMVERELALRGRVDAFPFMPGQRPPLLHHLEGRSLDQRIRLPLAERFEGYNSVHGEFGCFEKPLPFHRHVEPKITEIPTMSEVEPFSGVIDKKEKQKVVFLTKHANLSGVKRKALTPAKVGASEPSLPDSKKPYLIGSKKNSKEEWSCAICQVSAGSERGLNEHLQGKRHKSKEAGLRAQRTGKNFSIGLVSKKTVKPIEPTVIKNPSSEQGEKINRDSLQLNKNSVPSTWKIWKTVSLKKNATPLLQLNQERQNGEVRQKMVEDKKNKFMFWCDMCEVGTLSLKVMNRHKKGKKHLSRLLAVNNIGGVVEGTQQANDKKIDEVGEKNNASETVDGTPNGIEVEEHQAAAEELVLAE